MKITVTQVHINAGERQQCYRCPIALAIKDAVPPGYHVEVMPHEARVGYCSFELPREAFHFILLFDERDSVLPFEFELPLERQFPELAGLPAGDPRCGVVSHAGHDAYFELHGWMWVE